MHWRFTSFVCLSFWLILIFSFLSRPHIRYLIYSKQNISFKIDLEQKNERHFKAKLIVSSMHSNIPRPHRPTMRSHPLQRAFTRMHNNRVFVVQTWVYQFEWEFVCDQYCRGESSQRRELPKFRRTRLQTDNRRAL